MMAGWKELINRRILAAFGLLILFWGGWPPGLNAQQKLAFIPGEVMDLGLQLEGQELDLVWKMVNISQETVKLLQAKPSCGCLTASLDRFQLAPGDTGRLMVHYSTVAKLRQQNKMVTLQLQDGETINLVLKSFLLPKEGTLRELNYTLNLGQVAPGDTVRMKFRAPEVYPYPFFLRSIEYQRRPPLTTLYPEVTASIDSLAAGDSVEFRFVFPKEGKKGEKWVAGTGKALYYVMFCRQRVGNDNFRIFPEQMNLKWQMNPNLPRPSEK
ncbi:MAG: DUF1573 domain-containing protein [Bacteroidia bacterium]|nr:DUF1573 domain-containing protein [Bacteroidia bacterium]